MTWPLTYRDRINLRGKVCGEEAYFMCQKKCKTLSNFLVEPMIITLMIVENNRLIKDKGHHLIKILYANEI